MNERRQWDSKTKAKIVLEGLKGRSVVDICTEYSISQSMYCIINGVTSFWQISINHLKLAIRAKKNISLNRKIINCGRLLEI